MGVVVVVVVVTGTVVVVVVGAIVVVVVVVVVVVAGVAGLSMSSEKPKAACRPAAAPTPGGSVAEVAAVVSGASNSASSPLGEKAAKAAIARRAITTQVANASSRVNLTPVRFRFLNKDPRCASMRGIG